MNVVNACEDERGCQWTKVLWQPCALFALSALAFATWSQSDVAGDFDVFRHSRFDIPRIVVFGWILSAPLILWEQFVVSQRRHRLNVEEILWLSYPVASCIVVVIVQAAPSTIRLGLCLAFMASHSLWIMCAVVGVGYHGYRHGAVEYWWTTFLGCLGVLLALAITVWDFLKAPIVL
jgi:hypothetical protein